MDRELMNKYGIDYEKGLRNCMGDSALFSSLLSMFLKDTCFPRAEEAFKMGDYKEVFSCLHELKGASGNIALMDLYNAINPLVDLLRGDVTEKNDEVEHLFFIAQVTYKRTYEGVAQILGGH